MKTFHIAALPGDGIGEEIMPVCVDLLERAAAHVGGFQLDIEHLEAGAALYRRTGDAFPEEVFGAASRADAILLGAMGLPSVRYPDGREIAPQLDLRERLELYAGVRPIKRVQGLPPVLADDRAQVLDGVIVRESTEGLFSSRGHTELIGDHTARDVLKITRPVCERLFAFSFTLARQRKARGGRGHVVCVDKANVIGAYAFFRRIFDEVAGEFPDIETSHCYVDAMALNLLKQPWAYDVMVTENMFGDILSDLAAGLVGGLGMAPSADIGDRHAVFQPCHGSAPDIAGMEKANPSAMILSGAMMMDWLGERYRIDEASACAHLIEQATANAFASGDLLPAELGGKAGTREIHSAVLSAMAAIAGS